MKYNLHLPLNFDILLFKSVAQTFEGSESLVKKQGFDIENKYFLV